HLRADGGVSAKQREISMRGRAGENFDGADVIEVAEATDDVAAEVVEVAQHLFEECLPVLCNISQVSVADGGELLLVLTGGGDLALNVLGEFVLEDGMGQLLQQDRRKIDVGF